MKQNSLNKGFTLIELLVVIAIICILTEVVVSSLGNARRKAKIKMCENDPSTCEEDKDYNVINCSKEESSICDEAKKVWESEDTDIQLESEITYDEKSAREEQYKDCVYQTVTQGFSSTECKLLLE